MNDDPAHDDDRRPATGEAPDAAAQDASAQEEAQRPAVELTFEEARVFGCLIEKSQATPEYYPLTLNALTAACNQKSSREPVVDFDEDLVEEALASLQKKGLVAFASGTGRVVRYIHRAGHNGLLLGPAQAAVVSLLLLRGPQTPGELRTRAARQHNFPDLDAVQHTLDTLMTPEKPFVEEAPRRSGQKEVRYRHRFFAYDPAADEALRGESAAGGSVVAMRGTMDGMRTLVEALRDEVRSLHDRVERLEALLK